MTQTIGHAIEPNGTADLEDKIKQVFQLFARTFADYSIDQIFLSFNGGKDCTVLLDLLKRYIESEEALRNKTIRIIYIQPADPFEEVENFVNLCESTYKYPIERRQGKLKQILEQVCEDKDLKAVVMGCRRTDPYCEDLQHMQLTDPSWPRLMRINPLLDWKCQDIWEYIRTKNVPYCSLYNEGYTSLGDRTNTEPNPHLKIVNETTGEISYGPAYHLTEDKLERAGRK